MTVVGSQRMIVYDDTEPLEKLKIYDARVEVPPHYDTFAEFTYSYHYGDAYVPYIKQDEPLKLECQHFLDCIREECTPIANGRLGLEVVRILEASGESLRQQGASVSLGRRDAVEQWQWQRQRQRARHGNIQRRSRLRQKRRGRMSSSEQLFQRIAPDVKLGQRVKIFAFTNLYGCEIGDDVQDRHVCGDPERRAGGQPLQDFQPQLSLRRSDDRGRGLHRPRRDVYQRSFPSGHECGWQSPDRRRTGSALAPRSSAGLPSVPARRFCAEW